MTEPPNIGTSPAPRAGTVTHEAQSAGEPLGLLDSEPPPEIYGEDDIAVLARDPYTLFVHWEITAAGRAAAHGLLGGDGALMLRLYVHADRDAPAEVTDHPLHRDHGRGYLTAPPPGARVAGALGLRAADGRFAAVAVAPRIQVPQAVPGTLGQVEWMEVAPGHTRGVRKEPLVLGDRTLIDAPEGALPDSDALPAGSSPSGSSPTGSSPNGRQER